MFSLPEEALRRQLATDSDREVLSAYLGLAHYEELRTLALQAAGNPPKDKGRVYLLPGIMGSRLGIGDEVLWIDPEKIGGGALKKLALRKGGRVRALDAMVPIYLKLKLKLELAGFDVRFHAYDWRQGLETLGRELLERMRQDPVEKISVVAHSMGGLVCRMAMGLEPRSKIARLIAIGTPHLGSFAPVLALRGVYPAVRKVATLDPDHTPETLAAEVFDTFEGLHHLLPAQALIESVERVRRQLAPPDERFVCIAGVNQETVTGMTGADGAVQYSLTCDGDSTVQVASATLPGVPAYYVDEIHPALPTHSGVAAAAIELLEQGTTHQLAQSWVLKHTATLWVAEEKLRLQDTQKKNWSTLTLEERRALLLGLALPI